MYLYIRDIDAVNIIYHPATLKSIQAELLEKESELELQSFLNNLEREVIEAERSKISRANKDRAIKYAVFFCIGFILGLVPSYF